MTVPASHTWEPRTGEAIDLVALGEGAETLRCAAVGRPLRLVVRPGLSVVRPVAGELFTIEVGRRWRAGRSWILQGSLLDARLDLAALGLEPLGLRLVVRRPLEWELERLSSTSRSDGERRCGEGRERGASVWPPTLDQLGRESVSSPAEIEELWEAGELDVAVALAGDLLVRDLRCLEAHALLGAFFLDGPLERRWTERALRHFRVGAAIAELTAGPDLDGRLPWRLPGNRGYLRCLAGLGRALGRLGEDGEAARVGELLDRLAPDMPRATAARESVAGQ